MTTDVGGLALVCTYCKERCDGTLHDIYGEYVLRRSDLVVCVACDEDFQNEDGPWNEW